jgi:hypothetical protein
MGIRRFTNPFSSVIASPSRHAHLIRGDVPELQHALQRERRINPPLDLNQQRRLAAHPVRSRRRVRETDMRALAEFAKRHRNRRAAGHLRDVTLHVLELRQPRRPRLLVAGLDPDIGVRPLRTEDHLGPRGPECPWQNAASSATGSVKRDIPTDDARAGTADELEEITVNFPAPRPATKTLGWHAQAGLVDANQRKLVPAHARVPRRPQLGAGVQRDVLDPLDPIPTGPAAGPR